MAAHFHTLAVKTIYKETPDCVVITFDIPGSLKDLFQFEPGQTITLKKYIGGEEIRRSYSICSAPYENRLSIAVKKVEGGKFSNYANIELKPGTLLEVMPPTGRFNTPIIKTNKKNYVAFAAGSGITPIISIIKAILLTESASSFTLVYGNRSRSSIIFHEELAGLKNKYPDRFCIVNILSREKTETEINHGRINTQKLTDLQKLIDFKSMDESFICGPSEMLFLVKEFLQKIGVDQKKIHFELFTTPDSKKAESKEKIPIENSGPKSKITIQLDGRSFDFELAYNRESILEAALKQGADLPFACKGGVCSTCRALVTHGEVKMDVNYALEMDEIAKGFILTCQSHPLTDEVVIDFDSR